MKSSVACSACDSQVVSTSTFASVSYHPWWSGTPPPFTLCSGSNRLLIYFGTWWFGFNILYHFLFVLIWFGWPYSLTWGLAERPRVQLLALKGRALVGVEVTRKEVPTFIPYLPILTFTRCSLLSCDQTVFLNWNIVNIADSLLSCNFDWKDKGPPWGGF